jgi:hypothetical protein
MSETSRLLREAGIARYFGVDSPTYYAIVRALARMPEGARAFALDECLFLSVGRSARGLCRPTSMLGDAGWLVVIDERLAPTSIENTVAHEVAHAMLGHDIGDTNISHEDAEADVRELVREWGFRGFGAEPPKRLGQERATASTGGKGI